MFCRVVFLLAVCHLCLALKEPSLRKVPGLRILLPNKLEQGAQLEVALSAIDKRGNPLNGLRVFNEKGEYFAEVLKTDSASKTATLLLRELLRAPRQDGEDRKQAALKLLVVPQKKDQRFRNLIESCTQLGVSEFIGVDSVKAGKDSNACSVDDHVVRSWIQSSVEQCERMKMPTFTQSNKGVLDVIKEAVDLKECTRRYFVAVEPRFTTGAGEVKACSLLEALDEVEGNSEREGSLLSRLPFIKGSSSSSSSSELDPATSGKVQDYLVIGPEGGWDQDELTSLLALDDKDKQIMVRPVTLGGGVLRSETAAVVGSGIYNCWLGEAGSDAAVIAAAEGEEEAKGFFAEKLIEIKELVKENGIAGLVALLIEIVACNQVILLPATLFLFHQRIGIWLPTPATSGDFWSPSGLFICFVSSRPSRLRGLPLLSRLFHGCRTACPRTSRPSISRTFSTATSSHSIEVILSRKERGGLVVVVVVIVIVIERREETGRRRRRSWGLT